MVYNLFMHLSKNTLVYFSENSNTYCCIYQIYLQNSLSIHDFMYEGDNFQMFNENFLNYVGHEDKMIWKVHNNKKLPLHVSSTIPLMEANPLFQQNQRFNQLNLYPPCSQPPEVAMGLSPHSDHCLLTVLLQNQIDGLQIMYDHKWVNVNPIPNSFLVNIADQLEVLFVFLLYIFHIYLQFLKIQFLKQL